MSQGKKFLGVNCGTNDAKVVIFSSTDTGGKRTYKCQCKDIPFLLELVICIVSFTTGSVQPEQEGLVC